MTNDLLLRFLWPMLWQSAVLATLVVILTFVLRNRLEARWRYLLWTIVLARLALPVLPGSPIGILPTQLPAQDQPQSVAVIAEPSPVVATPYFAEHRPLEITPPTMFPTPASHENEMFDNGSPERKRRVDPALTLGAVIEFPREFWLQLALRCAFVVWLIGALYFAFRYVSGEIWLHVLCRKPFIPVLRTGAKHLRDYAHLESILHECQRELRIRRRVRLYVVRQDIAAASCGILFPKIILSERVTQQFSPDALRFVLLHELAHIKRFDPAVHLLTRLVTIFHWPNPVLWLTRRGLDCEREQACDAAVLRQIERKQRRAYGKMVLKFADWHTPHRDASDSSTASNTVKGHTSALVGVFPTHVFHPDHDLKRRITMITKHKPSRRRHTLLGLTLIATLALAGLTTAKPGVESALSTEPVATVDENVPDIPPGNVLIRGTVVDSDEKPVANAKVRFQYDLRGDFGETFCMTNAEGKYFFLTLERNLTNMQIIAVSPDDTQMTWGAIYDERPNENRIIDLTTKLMADNVRVISGTVTDADGKPIANAYVGGSSECHMPMFTKTDSAGNFRFPFIGNPLFQVYAIKPGVGVAWVNTEELPAWEGKTPPEKITNGPFHLVIQDRQFVQVLVTDENGTPLPGCRLDPSVQIGDDVPKMWYYSFNPGRQFSPSVCFATTDQNGLATFDWIPKKDLVRFTVTAHGPSEPIKLPDGSSKYFGESGYHYWDKTDKPMAIQLSVQAKVKGKIVNPDGTPAAGYNFYIEWGTTTRPAGGQAIHTDQNGGFELTGNIHDTFYTGCYGSLHNQGLVFPNVYNFDLGDGSEAKELNLKLQKGTRVFGDVFGEGGQKIDWTEQYRISGKNISPEISRPLDRRTSFGVSRSKEEGENPEHAYQMFLPPGTYEFKIELEWRLQKNATSEKLLGDTQQVTITDGQDEVRLDFHLKPVPKEE